MRIINEKIFKNRINFLTYFEMKNKLTFINRA